MANKWQGMANAPWDKNVLLRGPSGYAEPHEIFIINGYRVRDWHGGEWNDMCGNSLSDTGWFPVEWMELPIEVHYG